MYVQYIENGEVNDVDPISYKGNQISNGFFNGFSILGAESFQGINYFALENNNSGDLKIYSADNEWNLKNTSFIDFGSINYYEAEDNFQQDFDGDGLAGFDFSDPFEEYGDIFLIKDQLNNIFAYKGKVENSFKNPIFYKGQQLNDIDTELPNSQIFENFEIIGAEEINEENFLALESIFTGDLAIWKLNNNWEYISYDKVNYETKNYYLHEANFGQDFNNDLAIGFTYTDVETEGNVDLLLNDQFNEAYVTTTLESNPNIFSISSGFNQQAITYKGQNVKESDEFAIFGESLIAAETIDFENKVAWEKNNNDLTIWTMNKDWEFESSTNIEYQSFEYFQYETDFNIDLDNDGVKGVTKTTIENDKFVNLLLDNTGLVTIQPNGSIQIDGSNEEIIPLYNFEALNTNDFNDLTIIAADTNLYKNKIVNQIVWAEKEGEEIINLELWEMDSNWNYVSSETIAKQIDGEDTVSYKNQELYFKTDMMLMEFWEMIWVLLLFFYQ